MDRPSQRRRILKWMGRGLRGLFAVSSAVSLLLCVAVAVIWVRSYWVQETWSRQEHSYYKVKYGENTLFRQFVVRLVHGTLWYEAQDRLLIGRHWTTNPTATIWTRSKPHVLSRPPDRFRPHLNPGPPASRATRHVEFLGFVYHSCYPMFGLGGTAVVVPIWFPWLLTCILPVLWIRPLVRWRRSLPNGSCLIGGTPGSSEYFSALFGLCRMMLAALLALVPTVFIDSMAYRLLDWYDRELATAIWQIFALPLCFLVYRVIPGFLPGAAAKAQFRSGSDTQWLVSPWWKWCFLFAGTTLSALRETGDLVARWQQARQSAVNVGPGDLYPGHFPARLGSAARDLLADHAFLSLLSWLAPILVLIALCLFWRDWRTQRTPPGHCQRCEYDLTGNVSGVCSECGTPVPENRPGR